MNGTDIEKQPDQFWLEIPYNKKTDKTIILQWQSLRDAVLNSRKKYPTPNDDCIECAICCYRARDITNHLMMHGGMSTDDYKEKYHLPVKCKSICDSVSDDKNPAYRHGGKFSPYSKKFIKYQTGEADYKIGDVIRKANKTRKDNPQRQPMNIEYWTSRGYSEIEASDIIRERYTFSVEKCIAKFGEEEGRRVWEDRQIRWQATMNAKSDEEKADINLRKIWRGCNVSRIERQLLDDLRVYNGDIGGQIRVRGQTSWVVGDIHYQNKIIEFNGDFWHANPKKYDADDIIYRNQNAAFIWAKDAKKIAALEGHGYSVFVVWESEYRKARKETVLKCLDFLGIDHDI